MTAEHARDDVVTVHTPMGSAYVGKCVCGWKTDEIGNKGAAGFSLSAHVKRGNGLPVFRTPDLVALAAKVEDAAVAAAGGPEGVARIKAEFDRITATEFGYALPATLVKVASNDYRIHDYRSLRMYGSESDPFTAKLQRREGSGWKTVATVEDEGHGGMWDVLFLDGKQLPGYAPGVVRRARLLEVYSRIPMKDLETGQEVTGYQKYIDVPSPDSERFVDWALATPGKDTDYDGKPEDWTPMAVLAVLIQEAQVAKELSGKRTRTCILEEGQDPSRSYGMLSGGSKDPKDVAAYLRRTGKPTARIWTSGAWKTVEEVLAS